MKTWFCGFHWPFDIERTCTVFNAILKLLKGYMIRLLKCLLNSDPSYPVQLRPKIIWWLQKY